MLSASDAVTLFCERAGAADASFRLTPENGPAVARICLRLDGIPLALELAAARIRVLSPEQIADRLDDRFRFLSAGSRTASARQQTLQATMDWSYDLLPEPERLLLQRMSVFAGSFDLEACESVAADGEALQAGEVLDLLAHLLNKSLVVADGSGREVRYRLLETVRQYADEKLARSGSAEDTRRRHRDYFVHLTNRIFSVPLSSAPWADWITRSQVEDDLRAALDWSLAEGDADAALSLVVPLGYYLTLAGRLGEGRARLERVLALRPTSRSVAWARAINVFGFLLSIQGGLDQSLALHEEALAVAREQGDTYEAAVAEYYIGCRALHGGDADRAEEVLTEAYEDSRTVGSSAAMGWCELSLGWVSLARGDADQARERFERAVELGRRVPADPPVSPRPGSSLPQAALEVTTAAGPCPGFARPHRRSSGRCGPSGGAGRRGRGDGTVVRPVHPAPDDADPGHRSQHPPRAVGRRRSRSAGVAHTAAGHRGAGLPGRFPGDDSPPPGGARQSRPGGPPPRRHPAGQGTRW